MREPNWKSYTVLTPKLILTKQQCKELINLGQAELKLKGTITDNNKVEQTFRESTISWVPFNKAQNIYKIIKGWMQQANTNFFGFDNMQTNEAGQYTEYSKGGFYKWHMDIPKHMSAMPPVRKISMSLLLNDPKEFEGGELEIYSGELSTPTDHHDIFKLEQGQAIFFASFLLHRVKPIISGNRKTLVMWFGGTPLR